MRLFSSENKFEKEMVTNQDTRRRDFFRILLKLGLDDLASFSSMGIYISIRKKDS
jgi:hypothetical protein